MDKKIFNPEQYGMVICPLCNSQGYIQKPKRQCCPQCRGFGFIKKEEKSRNMEVTDEDKIGDEVKSDFDGEDCT